MSNNFNDMNHINQAGIEAASKAFGEWGKGFQAIASEIGDYNKRSFENGSSAVEKLLSVNSVEQALEIQSEYARQAYDDYMQQYSRLGSMYSQLAQEAFKPLTQTMQSGY